MCLPAEMPISLCHSLVFPGEVFLGRASDFFLEEAQEMLRVLEAEHVGDLLHACLRLEQGVLRSFDYLELSWMCSLAVLPVSDFTRSPK